MIEYLIIGLTFIALGITASIYPDGITRFYMFISHIPMKTERWRAVWCFLGKYLIAGGVLLILVGLLFG